MSATLLSETGFAAATIDRQSAPDDAPPIHLATLASRCLDDGASCRMMLHKFAARSLDQVAALARALDSGNTLELAREAHTLKGVAAGLAADRLCARAGELERAAERGDLAAAGLALARTRDEIDRCATAAGELFAQLSTHAKGRAS